MGDTETMQESCDVTIESNSVESTGPAECHETVDPKTRSAVLDRYDHRCQACGRRGPQQGGLATLHVHHIQRNPDGMDEHEMGNLTLLCRPCHSWLHQQSTPDDSPVEITEADQRVLLPKDIEILRYLAEAGPSRTGGIAAGLSMDLSVSTVRERLWVLMGLDTRVESREQQVVDKDVETGEWGLTEQIETSARGHIPDDRQLLLQRMEDEQVRQALERGCKRSHVKNVFGITRRTTFDKVKRAYAYDFPLSAFSRGAPSLSDRQARSAATQDADAGDTDEQQRLDAIAENGDEGDMGDAQASVESDQVTEEGGERDPETDGHELREQLQHAITALQEINHEL